MMHDERRLSIRKPLERLAYISLPFNNGGIVLDASEGGLGFHAIAPVEADGPIHFRFAVDSPNRMKAVGELAWKDETGKTGGLRFTELPDDVRDYIRTWLTQTKANVLDVPAAKPALEAGAAPSAVVGLAPGVGTPVIETAAASDAAPEDKTGLTPAADASIFETAAGAEALPGDKIELPPFAATQRALLYNSKPAVYSAPSYDLSMFSDVPPADAYPGMAEPRPPFPSRHPIAALVLTIFLASVVGTGIFAYVSTTQAGDVLYYLGEKVLEGLHSQPAANSPAPQASSAPDASQPSQR